MTAFIPGVRLAFVRIRALIRVSRATTLFRFGFARRDEYLKILEDIALSSRKSQRGEKEIEQLKSSTEEKD